MFRVLPPFGGDQRAVAEVVNGIMNGKTNNTGTVALSTGWATSTAITDARIGIDSTIIVIPYSDAAENDASINDPGVVDNSEITGHTVSESDTGDATINNVNDNETHQDSVLVDGEPSTV